MSSGDRDELAEQLARFRYERFRAACAGRPDINPVPYEQLRERTRRTQIQQATDDAEWFADRLAAAVAHARQQALEDAANALVTRRMREDDSTIGWLRARARQVAPDTEEQR